VQVGRCPVAGGECQAGSARHQGACCQNA
jgi:hypothetical protein